MSLKGTVQERYTKLCQALRSIDAELPDKLNTILEIMDTGG